MTILQIEHPVRDFDRWKQVFDRDPLGRQAGGVLRHEILRPLDDPGCAIVALEFSSAGEARAFLAALQELWRGVQGTLIEAPRARVLEVVETRTY
jgi:hypothetical protein